MVRRITSREIEILDMISMGYSTQEIAKSLYISENTVKTHRKNMMIKMDAKNAVMMVRKAFEYGLLNVRQVRVSRFSGLSLAS